VRGDRIDSRAGEYNRAMEYELDDFSLYHDTNGDWLARHVVQEARRGRRLVDVLDDEAVRRRCDRITRAHVLDRPEVVRALAGIAVAQVKDEIARARRDVLRLAT
jgi:hypothetical protein